jgi:hypothetical protein
MDSIEGTVLFAQESRFQLLDRNGVGHHFILASGSAAEPEQLAVLQRDQSRVRVRFRSAHDVLAHLALRIDRLDA